MEQCKLKFHSSMYNMQESLTVLSSNSKWLRQSHYLFLSIISHTQMTHMLRVAPIHVCYYPRQTSHNAGLSKILESPKQMRLWGVTLHGLSLETPILLQNVRLYMLPVTTLILHAPNKDHWGTRIHCHVQLLAGDSRPSYTDQSLCTDSKEICSYYPSEPQKFSSIMC